ncbi:MAG: lipopolysaccharide core heptose(I) kinase RfaP [Pseudomonadales bacterium]|nr:lipopolysaccharide core heptose(I) kinase RfaP [Pseudomonadales bacterium]MDP6469528.1 lipopolysaccharide core heptose(I) kinase RfaP [Pseudomonadales bacterium]MDP6827369.1 lipopolysaccharide core heptose(I) kinase RfaP [Pseudomonadales bacterium]MDP6971192.1 lipopolysaccharide core heptose(I) kinase RfaP [Pseudomonadales bacterium]
MSELFLREDLATHFGGLDVLEIADRLQGEVYRQVARRRTVRMEIGGRAYFAKVHEGVGWGEIFKNWMVLKPAVIGAENEYLACLHLEAAGVRAPTVAGYGSSDGGAAQRTSWVICDELAGHLSLEDLVADWEARAPTSCQVHALVEGVASFVRNLHGAGVVHRDLYICHLLIDQAAWREGEVKLAVLDLHRAQIHDRIPREWLLRDLAALLFSTLDLGLSRYAWLRFVRRYRGRDLHDVFDEEGKFWRLVHARAQQLYRKGESKGLVSGAFRQ